jgi:hypothetical protein
LQLADLVAHALYKTVDGGPKGVIETRYLKEIRNKFYQTNGIIVGNGLYPVHSIDELSLSDQANDFYNSLTANFIDN